MVLKYLTLHHEQKLSKQIRLAQRNPKHVVVWSVWIFFNFPFMNLSLENSDVGIKWGQPLLVELCGKWSWPKTYSYLMLYDVLNV